MIPGANVVEKKRRKPALASQDSVAPCSAARCEDRSARAGLSCSAIVAEDASAALSFIVTKLHEKNDSQAARRALATATGEVNVGVRRGLMNASNSCFLNAVVQALVSVPLFARLAVLLRAEKQLAPTWSAFGSWYVSTYLKSSTAATAGAVPPPRCLVQVDATSTKRASAGFDGRHQQDAHEYMVLLLQALRGELCAFEAHCVADAKVDADSAAVSQVEASGKGWITVGRGKEKKMSVCASGKDAAAQNRHDLLWSLLFGGQLHTFVRGSRSSAKGVTSVTTEPFVCLSVDVEIGTSHAPSVAELIAAAYGGKESVEDASTGNDMSRRQRLGVLPQVLIVHCKRWAFTSEGDVVKLENAVDVEQTLVVPPSVLAGEDASAPGRLRSYTLSAVVSHRGHTGDAGHYVAYVTPGVQQHSDPAAESECSPPSALLLCNDHKLGPSSFVAMRKDCPYLLVYVRKRP